MPVDEHLDVVTAAGGDRGHVVEHSRSRCEHRQANLPRRGDQFLLSDLRELVWSGDQSSRTISGRSASVTWKFGLNGSMSSIAGRSETTRVILPALSRVMRIH